MKTGKFNEDNIVSMLESCMKKPKLIFANCLIQISQNIITNIEMKIMVII